MKSYRIAIAKQFPAYHKKAGQPTNFIEKIDSGNKIHTIRSNYEYWAAIFEQINQNNACLELYYHSGRPYHSKQITHKILTKNDGIGIEKVWLNDYKDIIYFEIGIGLDFDVEHNNIHTNDGLKFNDFLEWFKKADTSKPFALIHFTEFRYL